MPSNIVLADAQATPVDHTFIPIGLDKDGTFWFVDQAQSNAVGYWRIGIKVKAPAPARVGESSNGRTYRVNVTLSEPILETAGDSSASGIIPAPTVAYIPRTVIEYILPERTTLLDRKNIRKMSYLLLNDAQVINFVENLVFPS